MEIRLSKMSVSLYKDHYGNKCYQACLYHYIRTTMEIMLSNLVLYHYIRTTMEISLSNLSVSLYKDHYGNKVIKSVCIII